MSLQAKPSKTAYSSTSCNKWETTSIRWQQIGPNDPMQLNSLLEPVNESLENLRKANWVVVVKTVKKVYTRRRRESPDELALSILLLRVAAAGGENIAFRVKTFLNLTRC